MRVTPAGGIMTAAPTGNCLRSTECRYSHARQDPSHMHACLGMIRAVCCVLRAGSAATKQVCSWAGARTACAMR